MVCRDIPAFLFPRLFVFLVRCVVVISTVRCAAARGIVKALSQLIRQWAFFFTGMVVRGRENSDRLFSCGHWFLCSVFFVEVYRDVAATGRDFALM